MTKWQQKIRLEELEEQMKNCERIKKNAKAAIGMSVAMIVIGAFITVASIVFILT